MFQVASRDPEVGTFEFGEQAIEANVVRLTFSNFCRNTRLCVGMESVWEQTDDNLIPWDEIETPDRIFTMIMVQIRLICDIPVLADKFLVIARRIEAFMRFSTRKSRTSLRR